MPHDCAAESSVSTLLQVKCEMVPQHAWLAVVEALRLASVRCCTGATAMGQSRKLGVSGDFCNVSSARNTLNVFS